jgi:two-component system, NtrC family, sensor kinase
MDVTLSQYRVYYKSLGIKMACAIVIVAVVPLLIMVAFSRHFFVGSYKQKVLDHLIALVRIQQQKVGEFLTERLDALRLIGLTTSFEQLSDEKVLEERWAALKQMYGKSLLGLAFCDPRGVQISRVESAGLKTVDQSASDMLAKVMELGSYVGEMYPNSTGSQNFILAVRVEQSAEKRILLATMGADALNVFLEDLESGQSGRASISNRSGALVTSGPSGGLLPRVECVETQTPHGLKSHDVTVGETADGSALCIRTSLKNSDWVLEFVANTEETYRAFSEARVLALSTLLLGIAGIVAVAIVASNRFSKYVARVDQEKQLMNEQVVQAGKLAALGEMASGMAHEINNPVGIMVQEAQWIEALLQKGEEGLAGNMNEITNSLNEIRTHGTRCRDVILKVISFTQKDEPIVQSLQLNELVQDVIGLCQQRANLMKIELRLNLEPELPMVRVASSDVQQVLLNLVYNSIDAMEQGGGAIEVSTSTRARYAIVDVMDTGPGISQGNLGRIFEPFFSTKPEGKGTGLGLSLCHSIMKKMKGDITVTSQEGKGTTFHLFFPLQEEERLARLSAEI